MLFEESIEVLHPAVTEERGHGADLGRWEDAEQVLREGQPDFDLKLRHRLAIFGKERPLERSHFYPEFSRKRDEPQSWVSVRSQDEVMCKPLRILKQCGIEVAAG